MVVAAGTYGTQRLLHRMRDTGVLPHLSPRLGERTRTNSESLLGATTRRPRADYSTGVAITSSFRPEPATHVEPVRYGAGSNLMGLLSTVLTDGGGRWPRVVTWAGLQARHPVRGAACPVGAPMVAAHGDRPRHAVRGQQPGRVRPPGLSWAAGG